MTDAEEKAAKKARKAAKKAAKAEATTFYADMALVDGERPSTPPLEKKSKKDKKPEKQGSVDNLNALAKKEKRKRDKEGSSNSSSEGSSDSSGSSAKESAKRAKKAKVEEEGAKGDTPMTPEEYRAHHNITIKGANPPAPCVDWTKTPFPDAMVAPLRAAGFASPSPIQALCWPLMAQGRDTIAVAKTGSGKTLGFLLPAFLHLSQTRPAQSGMRGDPPKVLVLAPTRELAVQVQGGGPIERGFRRRLQSPNNQSIGHLG